MLRNIIVGFLIFGLVLAPTSALAHETELPHEEAGRPSSFELFWPLVAGKTMDDGFVYTLKRLKETIRGWFIFGTAQKADYAVFLGTKRVLEAEKLLDEDKSELASKTLDAALSHFREAGANLDKSLQGESGLGENKDTISSRLENLEILLTWLSSKVDNEKVDEVLNTVKELRSKV